MVECKFRDKGSIPSEYLRIMYADFALSKSILLQVSFRKEHLMLTLGKSTLP